MKIYWLPSLDHRPHGYYHLSRLSRPSRFLPPQGDIPAPYIEMLIPGNQKTIEAYIILLHELAHHYQDLNQEPCHRFSPSELKLELRAWRIAKAMIQPKYYDLLDIMAIPRLINYSYECDVYLKKAPKIIPLIYRLKK